MKTIKLFFVMLIISMAVSCEKENDVLLDAHTDGTLISGYWGVYPVTVTKQNEYYLFEGDIVIPKDEFSLEPKSASNEGASRKGSSIIPNKNFHLWPNGIIPYSLENLPANRHADVYEAITHWEDNTGLKFIKQSIELNFIEFIQPAEYVCNSVLGKYTSKKKQLIRLGVHCGVSAIIHEIGHAVGLRHEHSRLDRDEHITLYEENMTDKGKTNSAQLSGPFWTEITFTDYDFNSIMHYHSFAFSNNGKPTMLKKDGSYITYPTVLSKGDIESITLMYPETSTTPTTVPTTPITSSELKPGMLVSLKGTNGKFVSSESGNGPMTCNRATNDGWWEQFEVVAAIQGRISLKSRGNNGKFVSSENENGQVMTCVRPSNEGWWEQFTVVQAIEGRISLKATNGKFVSSENGNGPMTCNRATNNGWWEQFTVEPVNR